MRPKGDSWHTDWFNRRAEVYQKRAETLMIEPKARDGWRFGPGEYVLDMNAMPDRLMLVIARGPDLWVGTLRMPQFNVQDAETGRLLLLPAGQLSDPVNEMRVLAWFAKLGR